MADINKRDEGAAVSASRDTSTTWWDTTIYTLVFNRRACVLCLTIRNCVEKKKNRGMRE